MPFSNSQRSYGSVAKTFHWTTVLLMLTVIPLGLFANSLAHEIQSSGFTGGQAEINRATLLFSLHKTIGVSIFLIALARIIWALTQPKPGLLNADNRVEALAAETVHWLLYGSLLFVPLTGWVHHAATTGFAPIWWPFGQNLPFVAKSETTAMLFGALHHILIYVLFLSVFLHVAGAIKHHVIDRDQTLRRMLPGTNTAPTPPDQSHSLLPAVFALFLWAAALGAGGLLGAFGSHSAQTDTAQHTSQTTETQAQTPLTADSDHAANWQVTSGTLSIGVTQMGSAVQGSFGTWNTAITFDPKVTDGQAGSVTVTIDVASLSLGSVTAQAMGADFFDSANFPSAKFQADISRTDDTYAAIGTLTIRDKTLPLTLPFTLEITDGVATMVGAVQVNRLDFDIGRGVKDEGSLAFGVDIGIDLTAAHTP
ncbi:cytochrome b/b6 domain-containing protein [Rhodobacteraceae bacterium M382]|nr:cytochrome b/b6 domain-containing protein [Rhodobacteraceae bacterium M382]